MLQVVSESRSVVLGGDRLDLPNSGVDIGFEAGHKPGTFQAAYGGTGRVEVSVQAVSGGLRECRSPDINFPVYPGDKIIVAKDGSRVAALELVGLSQDKKSVLVNPC